MKEQLIRYINTIIKCNDEEREIIVSFFKPLSLNKNDLLLTHGQTSQRTFFVGKGCLRIFFINEQAQDATRYFAFENQFATALASFITGQPSEEFIQAIEPSEVLYITHKDFYYLLGAIPQWETFYRRYLERAYVHNTKRLMSSLVQDATENYRQLLNESPIIVRRLPNKIVASYPNISQGNIKPAEVENIMLR